MSSAEATQSRAVAYRKRQLAQIHLAAKELGMDDDTYRDMLWTVARVRSARDLDAPGRRAVIDHLVKLGHKPKRRGRTRTTAPRESLASKIRAQLAAQDLSAKYADGIAKQMFKVERWEWCAPDQLRKIVAALEYRQRKAEAGAG